MKTPEQISARISEIQAALEKDRREDGWTNYIDTVLLEELDKLLHELSKWTCKLSCKVCGRLVISCPDPACDYHHGLDGMADYPEDCKEDLTRDDLNIEWEKVYE